MIKCLTIIRIELEFGNVGLINCLRFYYPGPRGVVLILSFLFGNLRREALIEAPSRDGKESLWSRPLGTSLSYHQLLTVVSDWRIFLIALRVI